MTMTQEALYENSYQNKNHFSFGKNWQDFLGSLSQEKIDSAKKSIVEFLGGEEYIRGKTFVDIGCGSGLFSYAAYQLGASRVVSVDVDEFSVACVTSLREREHNPDNWEIRTGSALDERFMHTLGQFDVVYSWGVLHHTGDMYRALDHVAHLVKPGGVFYTAIYGKSKNRLGGTSEFWLRVKKKYNRSGPSGKRLMEYLYVVYFFVDGLLTFTNPIRKIKTYRERGMNWYNDIVDWLGGYPYEFATPSEMIEYFGARGLYCKKLVDKGGLACNDYLFVKSCHEGRKNE